jgi:hypothetical protein
LSDIQIICYSLGIPITFFKLDYQNGLIFYNENNNIKISSIFPECSACDIAIGQRLNKLSLSETNHLDRKNTIDCAVTQTINNKSRHNNLLTKAKLVQQSVENTNKENKRRKRQKDDDRNQSQNSKITNEQIPQYRSSDKFKVFESDKRSYKLIKKDIMDGTLKSEDINPFFVLKYDIFKILESRNSINFDSNDNINEEYSIFAELYDDCLNIDSTDNEKTKTINVYIPPNYNYMSDEKKNEYAKKYKMTRKQFEEKYINCVHNDNNENIESFIENIANPNNLSRNNNSESINTNEINFGSAVNDIYIKSGNNTNNVFNRPLGESCDNLLDDISNSSSDDSDYDSDSSDEKVTKPRIDPIFLELAKAYMS